MPYRYPAARQDDLVEELHGEAVPDPYRWLEDPDSPDTAEWVAAENELTQSYLATIPSRSEIHDRLAALWNFSRTGVPWQRGDQWFVTRNDGLQNQPVLYVGDEPAAANRALLDPNALSPDGTLSLNGVSVSDDGTLLAYASSDSGSDWQTWHVREVATGEDRPDELRWGKFTGAAWRADGTGFYYGAMRPPAAGAELREESRAPEIRFHQLGTPQGEDEVVFATPDQPEWLPDVDTSADGRFVIVSITRGTNPEVQTHVLDLESAGTEFRTLIDGFAAKSIVIGNDGPTFYVQTDQDADRGRIVSIDLDAPQEWVERVPETDATLIEAHHYGGKLFCHYLRDAHSALEIHHLDGTPSQRVALPPLASVAGERHEDAAIQGRVGSNLVHYRVTSFSESGAIWQHDLESGDTTEIVPSTAAIDATQFVTEQVVATSADGTNVPMFVSRRKDVTPSGDNPVLLYGYGGFDIPITPAFSVQFATWMERGGLLAVANLRGGGEFGRSWNEAGRLANKQRVFDDFVGCARWLHASGWSRPDRTAIMGGSNGGLLVGACLTQHPDLFGAAVADVGVFDMLRFHRWTIGWAWTSDFGSPEDAEQFGWLRAYSPLHNIRKGVGYPATLLLTGDHDDRVVPAHSFKFAAALQAAQGGDRPVLLRVETAAGHGHGKPTSKLIAESTDRLAFVEGALGVRPAAGPG